MTLIREGKQLPAQKLKVVEGIALSRICELRCGYVRVSGTGLSILQSFKISRAASLPVSSNSYALSLLLFYATYLSCHDERDLN